MDNQIREHRREAVFETWDEKEPRIKNIQFLVIRIEEL